MVSTICRYSARGDNSARNGIPSQPRFSVYWLCPASHAKLSSMAIGFTPSGTMPGAGREGLNACEAPMVAVVVTPISERGTRDIPTASDTLMERRCAPNCGSLRGGDAGRYENAFDRCRVVNIQLLCDGDWVIFL